MNFHSYANCGQKWGLILHGLILARVNTNTFFIEQIVGDHGSGLLANGRQSSSQMNEKKRKEKEKEKEK